MCRLGLWGLLDECLLLCFPKVSIVYYYYTRLLGWVVRCCFEFFVVVFGFVAVCLVLLSLVLLAMGCLVVV